MSAQISRLFASAKRTNSQLRGFELFAKGFAGDDVPLGALLKKPRVSLKRQICRGRHIVELPDEQPSAQAAEEARRKRPPPPPDNPRESHRVSPEEIRAARAFPYDACNCCERVAEEIAELNENGKKGKLLKCGRWYVLFFLDVVGRFEPRQMEFSYTLGICRSPLSQSRARY